jgi:hypothetical protein
MEEIIYIHEFRGYLLTISMKNFNFTYYLKYVRRNNFIVVPFYDKPRKVDVEQPHHFENLYS